MFKPITGKTHAGERREKHPNSYIYICERIMTYNLSSSKTNLNWLSQRSLTQIPDWFDCIETTKVKTVMGSS